MRKLGLSSALLAAVLLMSGGVAMASIASWSETWEGYDVGATTPYGEWELQTGTWGAISTPGRDGSDKCYKIPPASFSRIRRYINLDNNNQIIFQGWFKDSGTPNYSMMGLAGPDTVDNNSMIRMGANGGATYVIQYYDEIAGGGNPAASLFTVDTGLPIGAGWHFFRLEISYTPNDFQLWDVRYTATNADGSVVKTGTFGWWFANGGSDWVTIGAGHVTTDEVCWDEVSIGAPVLGISNRALQEQPAATTAHKQFHYKVWGWVSVVDADNVILDDGSGMPIRVNIGNHTLTPGQFVSAVGYWKHWGDPKQLDSGMGSVEVLN